MEKSLSNISLSTAHKHLPQPSRMNSTTYNSNSNNLIGNFNNANTSHSNGAYSVNVNENQIYSSDYYSSQNSNVLQQNRLNPHLPKVIL